MSDRGGIHLDSDLSAGGVLERHDVGTVVFSQGERPDSVYFVCSGRLIRSVCSESGKQTVVSMVMAGDVFGEAALLGMAERPVTVTAIDECLLLRFERSVMQRKLEQNRRFAALFLDRVMRLKVRADGEAAQDRLLSSESRLARILLLLAGIPGAGKTGTLPKITQETLASIVGTTRPRVSTFMARFRALGHIEDRNGMTAVHTSLETLVRE
jgi:CRP/FNR family transcriptional regulator, cyclic AMP receptor protein